MFGIEGSNNIVGHNAVETPILEMPYADIKVVFKSMPYYGDYASRSWGGGGDYNLEYRIMGGGQELFFDSTPIEMSEQAPGGGCKNPAHNELIGRRRVGPWNVNIADGDIGFYMDDVGGPLVSTVCRHFAQTGFYVRIKNTGSELITVHKDAFQGIKSVRLIEDYKPLMIAEALIEEQGNTDIKSFINTPITATVDEDGSTIITTN
jgi:hypothetical protein